MNYIDIHCHLDFPDYDSDRKEVLGRMKEKGIEAITIGTDLESSRKAVELANKNENIWATIGVHPHEIGKDILPALPFSLQEKWQNILSDFSRLVKNPKVVAIGECGLDYFRIESHSAKATRDKQKELFESQIQFAIKNNKPLMLHVRNAYDDVLDILKDYPKARGNVHFFAGGIDTAKKFLDLGFTLSFTGVITFTHDYDEVIKYIPQNSIMSETDAPFVAPVPYRGERNEPVYVVEVVRKLAEIRGEEFEMLSKAVVENARALFNLNVIINH